MSRLSTKKGKTISEICNLATSAEHFGFAFTLQFKVIPAGGVKSFAVREAHHAFKARVAFSSSAEQEQAYLDQSPLISFFFILL